MMTAFAIYRLPRQEMCTCVIQKEGEVAEIPSCSSLTDKQGFVFAPFVISTANPILLIRPDEVLRIHPDALNSGDYKCSCVTVLISAVSSLISPTDNSKRLCFPAGLMNQPR